MEKAAIKDLLYGGLTELMNNKTYYYHSTISSDYSKWTEAGIVAVNDYSRVMAELMIEAEEQSLNRRAKDLVIKGLKGETL